MAWVANVPCDDVAHPCDDVAPLLVFEVAQVTRKGGGSHRSNIERKTTEIAKRHVIWVEIDGTADMKHRGTLRQLSLLLIVWGPHKHSGRHDVKCSEHIVDLHHKAAVTTNSPM